ncbi:MAG: HDOD domain-containing protein [Azonexus sp.]|jgi:EAL and modified HD-GYP domain-containing signal transduction protein|nr:HDOD domain-containing protein [Azonexus sp.]
MFSRLKKRFGKAAATPAPAARTAAAAAAFLRRDAVFNRQGRLAGHLFRIDAVAGTTRREADGALLAALSANPQAWRASLAFVPISSASLDLAVVDALADGNLVLLLDLAPLDAGPTFAALCQRLEALSQRGVAIGLYRQPGHPDFGEMVPLTDYGVVDVAATDPDQIRQFSAAFRAMPHVGPALLLALGIETADEHRFCHHWHFDYFQGAFADAAPPPANEAADPGKMQLLHLLRLVQSDAETHEIAAAIKEDPPLTFRLLRYLNSPLQGLSQPVDSITQALTLLGRQPLLRWLTVLLFSVHQPLIGDWLLVNSALTRGRLMELLGVTVLPGSPPDALFLTGAFSCLDRLLRQPLAELLAEIPLAEEIRTALLNGNGPYAPLLALAEAADAFDRQRITPCAAALGIPADTVNRALLAATAWASEVSKYWD